MTFKEKYTLLGLIDEFHWNVSDKEDLYVFVSYYNMPDFMKFFYDKLRGFFNEDFVKCKWGGEYMCFPHFEKVLEYLDLSEEEIHEMFEEE